MSDYVLSENLYLSTTPGGCYYAVQDQTDDLGRNFLNQLLKTPTTPAFDIDIACEYSGLKKNQALEFIHWMQEAGFIQGQTESESAPSESLEKILPGLLKSLSSDGKAVLAEGRGLYLGAAGFPHEAAEELAALSANLTAVYARHKDLLQGNLGFTQRGWGLIDDNGNSEIGLWPIYIGKNRFTLIIQGVPQFNQPAYKDLVWALGLRYSDTNA